MVKLTNSGRDAIHDRAMLAAFESKYNELVEARRQWAADAYRALFTAKEFALLETIPDGWLAKSSTLHCAIGTHEISMPHDGDIYNIRQRIGAEGPQDICRPEPNSWSRYDRPKMKGAASACARRLKQHSALIDRTMDLESEVFKASVELKALLKSATTLKRLETIWPEGRPFFEMDLPPEPIVAQRHDVNKKLGLAK